MSIYRYRLLQRCKDGALWSQPDNGVFLFGIDRYGTDHETGTVSEDFSC